MKRIVLALLASLAVAAPAAEFHKELWSLSATETAECEAGGGCVFAPRQVIMDLIDKKSREMAGSCGNRT